MDRQKKIILFAIYGPILLLALIGILLDSEIYLVAIFGISTAALFGIYGQMYAAAKQKMSDSAKSIQSKIVLLFLIISLLGSILTYIFFGNLGLSGIMLGTAASCAHSLANRYTW